MCIRDSYKAGSVSYRGRTGTIKIPANLGGIIERVLGLDLSLIHI